MEQFNCENVVIKCYEKKNVLHLFFVVCVVYCIFFKYIQHTKVSLDKKELRET